MKFSLLGCYCRNKHCTLRTSEVLVDRFGSWIKKSQNWARKRPERRVTFSLLWSVHVINNMFVVHVMNNSGVVSSQTIKVTHIGY